MSLDATLARISQLHGMLQPVAPQAAPATAATTPATSFATTLDASTGAAPATSARSLSSVLPTGGGTSAGQAALAAAQGEVGVKEQPPGSNDSPRIAEFRQAVAGGHGPGAWCAYFASWAARQAGAPLGDYGQGFAAVDDVWSWAQSAGRTTQTPQPGDLIVWDEHIGIVESVGPDGSVSTVEGNSSDQVARRTYAPGERPPVGYVRLG